MTEGFRDVAGNGVGQGCVQLKASCIEEHVLKALIGLVDSGGQMLLARSQTREKPTTDATLYTVYALVP